MIYQTNILREQQDPCACGLEYHQGPRVVPCAIRLFNAEVIVFADDIQLKDRRKCGGNQAQQYLHAENEDDLFVGKLVDPAHLELGAGRIHHDLGVVPAVDHEAEDPVSVTQGATS